MKRMVWLVVMLMGIVRGADAALPTAPLSCELGTPNPDAPAELTQFAFLVGNYSIALHAWQGDAWSPALPGSTARWNGRYGLNGTVIYDEWFNPDPAQAAEGNWGVNVRMYDPAAKQWKMMWIANSTREIQDLRAEVRDGVLTMWQVYPARDDFKATFTIHDADHWERVSYTRDATGEWAPQYKLAATRIPCP